jgi:hypothetical protein
MCTADNSWRWAQKMPETCRVSWQNKFWIFDAPSWLFYTKLITMHGHLNIKSVWNVWKQNIYDNISLMKQKFVVSHRYKWAPRCWGWRSHLDTPHVVGLLGKSDQSVTNTSTWQHTTLITDRHACPRRESNPQSQQSSGRKTHALDRAATGSDTITSCCFIP